MPFEAALGLGGNLGDPPIAMAKALHLLDAQDGIRVNSVSRLYRTPPWGNTDQNWFYNCCATIATRLQPHAVLDICLDIERQLKRKRLERWGPRIIDIDVLTYGDEKVDEEGLTIPHPHMLVRGFVLLPLMDVAANQKIAGKTVVQWAEDFDATGIEPASTDKTWWLGAD